MIKGDVIETLFPISTAVTDEVVVENFVIKSAVATGKLSAPNSFLSMACISVRLTLSPAVFTKTITLAEEASVEYPVKQVVYLI